MISFIELKSEKKQKKKKKYCNKKLICKKWAWPARFVKELHDKITETNYLISYALS